MIFLNFGASSVTTDQRLNFPWDKISSLSFNCHHFPTKINLFTTVFHMINAFLSKMCFWKVFLELGRHLVHFDRIFIRQVHFDRLYLDRVLFIGFSFNDAIFENICNCLYVRKHKNNLKFSLKLFDISIKLSLKSLLAVLCWNTVWRLAKCITLAMFILNSRAIVIFWLFRFNY